MSKMEYQVRIEIVNTNEAFVGEPLFLAGNFNNWAQEHICIGVIPAVGDCASFVLAGVPPGELELRLSRGDFQHLSCSSDGRLLAPARLLVEGDCMIELAIESWRELFPASTASKQVHVLDEAFYFPNLDVQRKIWIYLPVDYSDSEAHFPVIYMHDGQHLFDERTSAGRAGPVEWKVDETIDSATRRCIVVAIDHADSYVQREQEMMVGGPHAKGWQYLQDIVEYLKPFVDLHYRTLPQGQTTAIAGSSLGGLSSMYAALSYPEVFGSAAVLSPSIWMDKDQLYRFSEQALAADSAARKSQQIYLYTGHLERRNQQGISEINMAEQLMNYHGWLSKRFSGQLRIDIDFQGKHGALYWQQAFANFYHYWQQKIKKIQITQEYNYEVNTK